MGLINKKTFGMEELKNKVNSALKSIGFNQLVTLVDITDDGNRKIFSLKAKYIIHKGKVDFDTFCVMPANEEVHSVADSLVMLLLENMHSHECFDYVALPGDDIIQKYRKE